MGSSVLYTRQGGKEVLSPPQFKWPKATDVHILLMGFLSIQDVPEWEPEVCMQAVLRTLYTVQILFINVVQVSKALHFPAWHSPKTGADSGVESQAPGQKARPRAVSYELPRRQVLIAAQASYQKLTCKFRKGLRRLAHTLLIPNLRTSP